MIYIETNTTKGAENLAYEEYFLTREDIKEPILMLWRNEPTIVVGAFQNTYEEINEAYVKENHIEVIRRTSGGGAVYQDLGNLCFTFISTQEEAATLNYQMFLDPVVKALAKMGIPAEMNGRNDLLLSGSKISGSATRIYKNRVLFHGTLLYSSNLSVLSQALCVRADKIASKGIKSVRARVTTIREHMEQPLEVTEFKEELLQTFLEGMEVPAYQLSEEERQAVQTLAMEKYCSFDWTYGKNPSADIVNGKRFEGGYIAVKLSLKKAHISEIHFEGDFLGSMELEDIEQQLVGGIYEKQAIWNVFEKIDMVPYFGFITKEEIIQLIMREVL